MKKVVFTNCSFDSDQNLMSIEKGSVGIFSYLDIRKSSIIYEDARFKGKSEPFTHKILIAPFQPINMLEGKIYVGLRLDMKDGTQKYLYLSEKPCVSHSSLFKKDCEVAEEIRSYIKSVNRKSKDQ